MKSLTYLFMILSLSTVAQDYSVVNQTGHTKLYTQYSLVTQLKFSSDSKYLMSGGNGGKSILWDVSTGRQVRSFGNAYEHICSAHLSQDLSFLALNPSGKVQFIYDLLTGEERFRIETQERFGGGTYNPLIHFDHEGNILLKANDYQLSTHNLTSSKVIAKTEPLKDKRIWISAGDFDPKSKKVVIGRDNGSMEVYDFPALDLVKKIKGFKGVNYIRFNGDGKKFIAIGKSGSIMLQVFDATSYKAIKSIKLSAISKDNEYNTFVRGFSVTQDGLKAVVALNTDKNTEDSGLLLYDLVTGKVLHDFNGIRVITDAIDISPDGQLLAVGLNSVDVQIQFFDMKSGELVRGIKTFTKEKRAEERKLSFDIQGKRLSIFDEENKLTFDLSTGATIPFEPGFFKDNPVPKFEDVGHSITAYFNHSTNPSFAQNKSFAVKSGVTIDGSDKLKITVVDCSSNETMAMISLDQIGEMVGVNAVSNDGKYAMEYPLVLDVANEKVLFRLKENYTRNDIYDGVFLPDNKRLLLATKKGKLETYNLESGKLIKTFTTEIESVYDLRVSGNGEELFVLNIDASVDRISLAEDKLIASYYAFDQENYATVWDNNYYRMSPKAYEHIHFVKGMQTVGFDAFDLVFNRPDKILALSGNSDPALKNLYNKAYSKRVKSLGFKTDQITTDIDLPILALDDYVPPFKTTERSIQVPIIAHSTSQNLDRVNVYVNNVPIYGKKGSPIDETVKEYSKSVDIPLNNGINKIEISVHNDAGFESVRTLFTVVCETEVKPDLYIVSIGVSDFQDSDFNLTYAAKDALDVSKAYSENASRYGKVVTKEFTNENATRANIEAVKEVLESTKVDDYVIVFVASHGLLDDDFSYYIATHDTDFYNPSTRALSYNSLEGLLDGIPARNKVMFLDACHSGEVDTEDVQLVDASQVQGEIKSRGFKTVQRKANANLQNSFELMKEIFADIRRGTGAIVISAAAGKEYAYESPKWNNGVFTYSMLQGLKYDLMDRNNDDEVQISEMKEYISTKVVSLTKGKQHPTSRIENLENDFVVW
ncbi:MAG: caspase family protein [Reichenbachiella sp.]